MDVVQEILTAYPAVFSDQKSAETLDHGGKILLPSALLQKLSRKNVVFPFQFRIQEKTGKRECYCGVLEFTAREGEVIIPHWAFSHLCIQEGSQVRLSTCSLPRANGFLISFRPQEKTFIELSDPRVILQEALKSYTVLSEGTTIAVRYINRTFYMDVTSIKDKNNNRHPATLIIDVDVHAEFERPLDMPPSPELKSIPPPTASNVIGSGMGAIEFTPVVFKPPSLKKAKESETEKKPFQPFGGQMRTLKPITTQSPESEIKKPEKNDSEFVPFGGKPRYLK